ncbi:AMP-binding protein, partial [[Flexibacter] sp. ATCC 35103]|uniref:AMP-binding protein n=1 Tax=[Flexibacter] sp. ATCC 35103 TaxID=1937528 RepID=UPI0009CD45C4
KNFNFYNEYGPTETTVTSIELLYDENKYLSIGKPIFNTQIYILNNSLIPVAVGVKGDIYIGGSGLTRGYLNNPLLTSEKFVVNPFAEGGRMYKTGDLGCWDADGNSD